MNAGDIQRALIRYVDWWQNTIIPEFSVDGYDRADLIQITKSGYITEYEIKVSAADWRADLAKPKWVPSLWPPRGTGFISRFFYVVPGKLVGERYEAAIRPPDNLPFGVGIILVVGEGPNVSAVERVAARRFRVAPITPDIRRRALEVFYYRYWRQAQSVNMHELRKELAAARKSCMKCGSRMRCSSCEAFKQVKAA